ncbi:helix-turn-helix domain-containing protein [Kribbella sp. NPDC054772]
MDKSRSATAAGVVQIASSSVRAVAGQLDGNDTYRTVRASGTTDWLLLVTTAGRGRLRLTDGQDLGTGPGEITLVEPYTPHDYGTDPEARRWSLRWAHLDPRPDWLPLLEWPSPLPGFRQLRVNQAVRDRVVQSLDRATAAARNGLRLSSQFAMNAVEEALLWCDTQNPDRLALDARLLAVVEHVAEHLDQPHTVQSLARIADMSATRLAHLARAQLGTSLMLHVQQQRIDLAGQLLLVTNLPIAEIAVRVGYRDPLYFSRRFRAATTLSPTEYRLTGGNHHVYS